MTALNLLYVDDDAAQIRALTRALRNDPFVVHGFDDVYEALTFFETSDVDVVVSDYQMPGMDGLTFLRHVAAASPDTPRLMVTGQADLGAAVSAINEAGVFRFLQKPWTVEALRQALQAAAENLRLKNENAHLNRLLFEKNEALGRANASLEARVHERTRNVLDSLLFALDFRDTETQWHSRRVAAFSVCLGRQLGLCPEDLLDLEWGALLHDVGKIGIPDNILLKPAALTAKEWDVMRRHAELGYELLRGVDFLKGAATIVQQHHERFDGSGYPRRLVGTEISLGARIFAVIDTFDAMTSSRPYRCQQSYAIARREIERVSGTQLDPDVVRAFCEIPEDTWVRIAASIGQSEGGATGPSAALDDVERAFP